MKRAKRSTITLILMAVLLLCGCEKAPNSSGASTDAPLGKLPVITEDYFRLLCDNTNVEISGNSYYRSVKFGFLSAAAVTVENVELCFDKDVPFTFSVEIQEEERIDLASYATYQGISWEKMAEDPAEREKIQEYEKAWVSIPENEAPKLYSGILTVTFNEAALKENVTLTRLTLKINSVSQEYDIGKLKLGPYSFYDMPGDGLMVNTVALTDMNILPSKEGKFTAERIELSAQHDVAINRVYFHTGTVRIDQISYIQQLPDGMQIDTVWDQNTPICLEKGATISFYVTASDAALQDTLLGNRQIYLIFEYTDNAEKCTAYCELTYRMRQPPFHAYAFIEDGLDILAYYTDYLPTVTK